MTNGERIKDALHRIADMADLGQLDEVLWSAAHTEILNPNGAIYELWCDGRGDCPYDDCDYPCPKDRQLACIRRYLEKTSEPRG
jgi:hypothetical protein